MKKFLPRLFAAALVAPAALAAASFEGKVTMKLVGPRGTPPEMIFSLKEGFSRIDLTAGKGNSVAMIFDAARQESTMVMLEQRMYLVQPMTKVAAAAGATEGPGNAVEVTTTTEKILGYDCVKYVSKGKDGTTETWVTDQLGAFLGMSGGNPMAAMGGGRGGPPPAQAWEQALAGKNVFPLRVITTANGKETFRMEATAVEKVALPASTFTAPADFQNLSQMMQGIPGMPPGMKLPGSR